MLPLVLHAQVNILTNRYDPQRTGANLSETVLTPANVNTATFGKRSSYPVDGAVYAQPLYMSGVTIGGSAKNVLFVATMNDRVYAFDADSGSPTPLWTRDFTSPPAIVPVPITDIVGANLNIVGNIGIQGTPVIDAAARTIFLVARTRESGAYFQRLHALDIATGAERSGSPVTITASVPGTAPDAIAGPSGQEIRFDPKVHVQRTGLGLANGVVLVAWASHEDITPSHGWIMGFDSATLARVAAVAVTPDSYNGGIWQGGRAPTIDAAGNAYFATGNGLFDGTRNFGDSLLKYRVSRTAGLTLLDYFTPANEATLNANDDDLSGSGFTLLPGTSLLVGGGKEGVLYVVDSTALGHQAANDAQIVQKVPVNGGHVMGGIVYWNSATLGPVVYNWSEQDVLKAYRVVNGRLALPAFAQGQVLSPGHPGGSLTLSARGSTSHTGIVWASMPTAEDAMHGIKAGTLRAFDAETLTELWDSDQNSSRDRLGSLMKFVPPVVVNGKVFLPNQDNAVVVYGLLQPDFDISVAPASRTLAAGSTTSFTVSTFAENGFSGGVSLTSAGAPSGASVSFNPATINASGTSTMTVVVPATAAPGTYGLTVTGTSGGQSHAATPVSLTVTTTASTAGTIGIDFQGTSPSVMSVAESAGVIAQSHWNAAAGAVRSTPLALLDSSGTSTGASVTWSAAGGWMTPIADQPGNARLMKGYLDTSSTSTTTVSITGLPLRRYDVYVYADGDNKSYARSGTYAISGTGITPAAISLLDAAGVNFTSTFTRANGTAGNYVKFTVTGGAFTITAAPLAPSTGTRRAPINAIQIAPAAAPAGSVAIDFTGSAPSDMGMSESAGVVAQSHWNAARGAAPGAPLPLVDATGASTAATAVWSASGTWLTPITDAAGNARMMKGYLDTTNTSTSTVTISGLASGTYDVYVYIDGDNRSFTRTGAYSVNAGGTATVVNVTDQGSTNFSGAFTAARGSAGNYVQFVVTGTGFTLSAKPVSSSNTTLRAPINGIQVVRRLS